MKESLSMKDIVIILLLFFLYHGHVSFPLDDISFFLLIKFSTFLKNETYFIPKFRE